MHLDDIQKVLQHCYNHQAESGPESSFWFGLFMGPKRKLLIANYPGTSNEHISESELNLDTSYKKKGKWKQTTNKHVSESEHNSDPTHKKKGKGKQTDTGPTKKKKGKGKQREDPLQGLYQIDENPTLDENAAEDQQNVNQSTVGPSNHSLNMPDPQTLLLPHHDLVRIDMGQMSQLKDMGYKVLGPVNGPNEGLPKYEVPKAWVEDLLSQRLLQCALTGLLNEHRHPDALLIEPDQAATEPDSIDPALLDKDPSQISPTNAIVNDCPTTPQDANADSAADPDHIHHKTPKQRLSKRGQPDLSPQMKCQTKTMMKRKKVTDNDLAALEAQQMMQSGTK